MYVTKIPIAKEEPILSSLTRVDYADAYSGSFCSDATITIEEVAYAFFDSAPAWVSWLLSLRDRIVKAFGLKTFSADERRQMRKRFRFEQGDTIGLFQVLKEQDGELWLGDNDKHLDYRVAMQLKQSTPNNYEVVFITTVMLHNWLGKVYFLPVKHFHKLVVRAMLRNTIQALVRQKTGLLNQKKRS